MNRHIQIQLNSVHGRKTRHTLTATRLAEVLQKIRNKHGNTAIMWGREIEVSNG